MQPRRDEALAVGQRVELTGYFTKRHVLGDLADGAELERRLGFGPGSLRAGWWVLFMAGMPPTANEFELGGYTHFSDSRVRGHVDPDGEHVEQWLRSHAIDVSRQREAHVRRFVLSGPERIVKIRSRVPCQSWWHPDPNPVPQWKLTAEKTFVVAEEHAGW